MKNNNNNIKNSKKLLKKELNLLRKGTLKEFIEEEKSNLDEDGNLHIDINVKSLADCFSDFSKKVPSENIISYMEVQNENLYKGAPLIFDFYFEDEVPNETEFNAITKLFTNNFKRKAYKNLNSVKWCNISSFFVLLVGAILVSIYIGLTATGKGGFVTEMLSIVSCFFVWTAADIFFFGKNDYKIQSFLYGRLALAKYVVHKNQK